MLNNPKKQDIDENILLSSVDKWLDSKVKPHVSKLEHDDTYPSEMVDQMSSLTKGFLAKFTFEFLYS